jgi:hypothetical protein
MRDQRGLLAFIHFVEGRLQNQPQAMQDGLVCTAHCAPQDVARIAARGAIEAAHRARGESSRRQAADCGNVANAIGEYTPDARNSRLRHLFVRARIEDVVH